MSVAFLGACTSGGNVLLGDLPFLDDASSAPETLAPEGSAGSDINVPPEATTPDASLHDAPTSCTTGEPVPATTREFLLEVIGFGRHAFGGANGCIYHVTSLADAGPGTFRAGAERVEPLWIVFDVSGDIVLASNVALGSNKTVDGRGKAITLRNFGVIIGAQTSNVVIENLAFIGNNQGTGNDGIQIADGAQHVWIDHCSLSNYGDGLIDITRGATDVTVSWSLFSMQNFVMLIGGKADDIGDVVIRVTLHHNWWNQTGAYAPRLRYGKAHVLNNLIDRWRTAASASTLGGEIYSEANIFIAENDKVAVGTSAGGEDAGRAESINDLFLNGASSQENEPDLVSRPATFYDYSPVPANDALQAEITRWAGVR